MSTNEELALTWFQSLVSGDAEAGKIVEMKEFCDSLHVFEAIDATETRGPRKPRESPLTTVTATVHGPTAGAEL